MESLEFIKHTTEYTMNSARQKVENKISVKEKEIQTLTRRISMISSEINGMKEALKYIPRDSAGTDAAKKSLRKGSIAANVYNILKKTGRPLYINDIMPLIKGKKDKTSVASVLSQYARKNEIFSRPEANTFGLLEWGATLSADKQKDEDNDVSFL